MTFGDRTDGTPVAQREIVVTRRIGGPPALVWAVFAEAAHLDRWWGPEGFTTRTIRLDFRLGGIWEFTMTGPDGTRFPNHACYREIVPHARIVFDHGAHADDPDAFISTITFAAEDDGRATLVTMRAELRTKAQRDKVIAEYGALLAAHHTLRRLDDYFTSLADDPKERR